MSQTLDGLVDRLKRSPTDLSSGRQHMSHGFYRVTDVEAGHIAKHTKAPLPRPGYELAALLPEDDQPVWLARTPVTHGAYGFQAPKRGWVWSVRQR